MKATSLSRILGGRTANSKVNAIPVEHVYTSVSPTVETPIFKFPFKSPPAAISNHKYFYRVSRQPPVWAQKDSLPALPTDIKGIDLLAYKFLSRLKYSKSVPTVASKKYFQLKFYPESHPICISRKSNIAYTFTNSSGGFIFNNPKLSEQFKKYNGKYKKNILFNKILSPLNSAVKRILFRRMVKRALFESLHKYIKPQDVKSLILKVRGVYQFRLFVLPKNDTEKAELQAAVDKAVQKILSGELDLKAYLISQRERDEFRRSLRLYRSPGEKNVRGYTFKFPFLGREKL